MTANIPGRKEKFRINWNTDDDEGCGEFCFDTLRAALDLARDFASDKPDHEVWVESESGQRFEIDLDQTNNEQ